MWNLFLIFFQNLATFKARSQSELTKRLHQVLKCFPRVKEIIPHKDECWLIDLIHETSVSTNNKGYNLIFTIFDSQRIDAMALTRKDKQGIADSDAFNKSFSKSDRYWMQNGQKIMVR